MSLSNKELLDKTLFLKDSVLFISIDGKEYEVINPEVVGGFYNHDENFILIELRTIEGWRFIGPDGQIEWPGNVNIVHQIKDSTGWITTHELMYSKFPDDRRRTVARLLPKEKKGRDHSVDLIAYMLGGIPDKGQLTSSEGDQQQFETAGTVTSLEPKTIVTIKTVESDYKQFEPKEVCVSKTCGDHTDHHRGEGRCEAKVESSEPQEKRMVCDKCNQPINWKIELTDNDGQVIPAPVESQEEQNTVEGWISLELQTPKPMQWVLVWIEKKKMSFVACRRAYPDEQSYSMWDSPFVEVTIYNGEIYYWKPMPNFTLTRLAPLTNE